MTDNRRVQDQLEELRSEIDLLLNLPALSPEFTLWLSKLFAIVKMNFGTNSNELHELCTISPELPPEFYDSIAERLDQLGLSDEQKNQLIAMLNKNVPQSVFQQRLNEYSELIGAMLYKLRNPR